MDNTDWRKRLAGKIKQSGMSMREVSLTAGKGEGYVFSILKDGKEPSIGSFIRLCQALDASVTYILYGFDLMEQEEELLTLFAAATPEQRGAVLTLLKINRP